MFWSEPTFQDNVKIEAVIASALPGGELSLGKHVIVYQVSNFIIYLHHVSGLNIFPSYKIFFTPKSWLYLLLHYLTKTCPGD